MGLSKAKILIIDDNPVHGKIIANTLWKSGKPVLFVHYSEQALIDETYGLHSGVRAIFLDINLTGDGGFFTGSHLYTPAEQALKKLLDDNNGPFALITWSSHDTEAEGLYQHLQERLPEGNRPVSLHKMDKDKLLQENEENRDQKLQETISGILSKYHSLRFLIEWEGHIQNSSAELVKNLATIADINEHSTFDKNLECLLRQLAQAEVGKKWLEKDKNISSPLYSLLATLLSDRLSYTNPKEYPVTNTPCDDIKQLEFTKWKCEINTFLHFDKSDCIGSMPGSLFSYPLDSSNTPLPVIKTKKAMSNCIRSHFLDMRKEVEGYKQRKRISDECELLLMDVTPPCDHAEKKVEWRPFIVVCKVPIKYLHYLWRVDKESSTRVEDSLKGKQLRLSPSFAIDDDEFILVFNANQRTAIPEPANQTDWETLLGTRRGRIREQLLSVLTGWLGGHVTRGGYVTL